MSRILVLTGDVVGRRMAGPAIRSFEIARALAADHRVVLGCPEQTDSMPDHGFEIRQFVNEPDAALLDAHDIVIVPGSLIINEHVRGNLVVDLYDPFILSNLARFDADNSHSAALFRAEFDILAQKLVYGDYFLCASEKQRDFWLGMLSAFRRINRAQFDSDPDLYGLIHVVPYGIPEEGPPPAGNSPFPAGEDGDCWVLWAGGIWNWFDPGTLIRAFREVEDPRVKLFFMGVRHPNPRMPEMVAARDAVELARKLDLLDRRVFFGDWIPYAERGRYLASARAGVSTHHPHVETRFSFRTRILDYIWARLPIICTRGDAMAALVETENLGITVPPGDTSSLAESLHALCTDLDFHTRCRQNLERIAAAYSWERVLAPLRRYCANPSSAPDRDSMEIFRRPEPRETFCGGCESSTDPAGEIYGRNRVTMEIRPGCSGLNRIDLKLATYNRSNSGRVFFILHDAHSRRELVRLPVAMEAVQDNAWHVFRFHALGNSAGRRYRVILEADNAGPGNAVTVWTDERAEGGYRYGRRKRPGSLTLRMYHDPDTPVPELDTFWGRLLKSVGRK